MSLPHEIIAVSKGKSTFVSTANVKMSEIHRLELTLHVSGWITQFVIYLTGVWFLSQGVSSRAKILLCKNTTITVYVWGIYVKMLGCHTKLSAATIILRTARQRKIRFILYSSLPLWIVQREKLASKYFCQLAVQYSTFKTYPSVCNFLSMSGTLRYFA